MQDSSSPASEGTPRDDVSASLASLLELPEAASRQLWAILGPYMIGPPGAELDRRVAHFAAEHELSLARLVRALDAASTLLFAAIRDDAQPFQLAATLGERFTDDEAVRLREVLLPGYETAKELIRRQLISRTISDHGALLTRVDWRVDRIVASRRGENLMAPIAVLTLHVREGEQQRRVTVQATVEVVRALRQVCDKLLS